MTKKAISPRVFSNPSAFEQERRARVRLNREFSVKVEVEDFSTLEAEVKDNIESRKAAVRKARERIAEINRRIKLRKDGRRIETQAGTAIATQES